MLYRAILKFCAAIALLLQSIKTKIWSQMVNGTKQGDFRVNKPSFLAFLNWFIGFDVNGAIPFWLSFPFFFAQRSKRDTDTLSGLRVTTWHGMGELLNRLPCVTNCPYVPYFCIAAKLMCCGQENVTWVVCGKKNVSSCESFSEWSNSGRCFVETSPCWSIDICIKTRISSENNRKRDGIGRIVHRHSEMRGLLRVWSYYWSKALVSISRRVGSRISCIFADMCTPN